MDLERLLDELGCTVDQPDRVGIGNPWSAIAI
jgi:hypothetical protein